MFTLEETLGLASSGKPQLVEVAEAVGSGADADATAYLWSTGRIGARVSSGTVHIKRRRGVTGDRAGSHAGVTLSADELRAVVEAARHWANERDRWAAYRDGGQNLGGYTSWWRDYCAPGAREGQRIAGGGAAGAGGRQFEGVDERRPLSVPMEGGRGPTAIAILWRVGERVGPREGEQVGLVYALPGGLEFEARRFDAVLDRSGGMIGEPLLEAASQGLGVQVARVAIEAGEIAFLEALISVIARQP